MQFKNTSVSYGWVTIGIHWLMAVIVFSLFGVGLWMEDLDYTHPLYRVAPHWHKSIGVLLVFVLIFRFIWRISQPRPQALPNHSDLEKRSAHVVHYLFYGLILLMLPTGYFITTAKGQSLDVFNWFSLPAVFDGQIDNLEDIAGEIHEWLAFSIIGLAALHALGALKHHFVDKDRTLRRMLKPGTDSE